MHGTVVYEIDGLCYYVTTIQDKTLKKFPEDKRYKLVKKVAYASGPPGASVNSPEGSGRVAVLTESKSAEVVEVTEEFSEPEDNPLREDSGYRS